VSAPALSVRELRVVLGRPPRRIAVDSLSFDLQPGEILGLVGESGCGKTKTAEAVMGLIPAAVGSVRARRLDLCGSALLDLPETALRRLRGRQISMVFQESLTALDPVFRAGGQVAAIFRRHRGMGRKQAGSAALDMLARVGFDDPPRVARLYPHQLSGGMRQRVAIAMAMACEPRVLIADEPTTALDVTTQAQVLDLLTRMARQTGTAVLLITHDLGVVAHYCDRALVMREGRAIEEAPVAALFAQPREPYTARLLAAARGEIAA